MESKCRNISVQPIGDKPVTFLDGIGEIEAKRLEAKGYTKVIIKFI